MTATDYHYTHQQQQVMLRLPAELADQVRATLRTDDQSLDFEVKPCAGEKVNHFTVVHNGLEYPALLINLPTPVETHKTFDSKIYLKSGDVGQMLMVFLKAQARDEAESQLMKTIFGEYFPSGISPPTTEIVKRRFELTRRNETFLPYQIRLTSEAIQSSPFSAEAAQASAEGDAPKTAVDQYETSVVEEIVDFEEWMVDPANPLVGRTIVLNGADWSTPDGLLLLQHPTMLITTEDREEDSIEHLAAGAKDASLDAQRNETTTTQVAGDQSNRDNEDEKLAIEDGVQNEEVGEAEAAVALDADAEDDAMEVGNEGDDNQYGREPEDDDDEAWMKDLEEES